MNVRSSIAFASGLIAVTAPGLAKPHSQQPLKPQLVFVSASKYEAGGKNWVRHRYEVRNWSQFPAELFVASPGLPPCGLNTNSARTWVDFYDSSGERLYGFCALPKPSSLRCIWFATELGAQPPKQVYVILNDRLTNKTYKSNLARTGPASPATATDPRAALCTPREMPKGSKP
jgi:hypothetical protein